MRQWHGSELSSRFSAISAACQDFQRLLALESSPPAACLIDAGQERSMPSQVASRALVAVTLLVLAPAAALCSGLDRGRRPGCLRGRAPGRDGRGGQPGPDRKDRDVVTGVRRTVPHRRSAARRLHRHLHAGRLQHRQARRAGALRLADGDGRCRHARRRRRGDDHRHRRRRRWSTCRASSSSGCSTRRSSTRCRPAARRSTSPC